MFILKCTGIGIESDWYRYWYWKALVLVLLLVLERYWYWKSVGERAGYGWVAPILAQVSHLWWLWGGGGPLTLEYSLQYNTSTGSGLSTGTNCNPNVHFTIQYFNICKMDWGKFPRTIEKPFHWAVESDILERFCQENFTQSLWVWGLSQQGTKRTTMSQTDVGSPYDSQVGAITILKRFGKNKDHKGCKGWQ